MTPTNPNAVGTIRCQFMVGHQMLLQHREVLAVVEEHNMTALADCLMAGPVRLGW